MPLGLKIVPQNCQGLVEMFGKYKHTVESGLHFYIPFIQGIRTVSLAMQPIELPHYSIITKDNAEVSTSVTLNYHVTDSMKYEYNNTDSVESMAQLVRGHLRDIIGRMELNDALGSTARINADLASAIGDLTNTYGINVDRINIDELLPSAEIQRAMDKQLTADRERIAAIAQAQGEAESIRLTNEAQNNALMATASAQAQATKTRADAERYRIDTVQAGLSNTDDRYFKNQSISAYSQLAKSQANMVVVPNDDSSNFGQTAVLAQAIKERNGSGFSKNSKQKENKNQTE
ncbi:SPFH domain-containing protein [Ligilactobacillus acidipiscis]|uniref:SPFH/Band 7/PHB domain protein n=1 Tax=Ligilactobacillus acidipiscis TaxID=89059 RepID=A0A921JZQ9_9LACO|nr:SPFH domain-containing protein [Ligilactobacillus acidipiscis]WEV57341.1 SPFH/Band 7/PHB domain protein [Ligilactobacillus acidipiscis]HJE96173.1 SPFH/Band 7/PHB domain protein [Ligilactobacillus acidipiscis]